MGLFMHRLRLIIKSAIRMSGFEIRRRYDWENPSLAAVPGGMKRIQYACGYNLLPGWLNVDLHPPAGSQSAPSLRLNLIRRHPFPDDWFDLAYGEDFLEHVDQADQITFLIESYRTLAPGGTLRLSFPYLDGVLANHYLPASYEAALQAKAECYDQHAHRSFPSRTDIELLGKHIGFSSIRFYRTGESDISDLRGLEHRVEQESVHLNVELTK